MGRAPPIGEFGGGPRRMGGSGLTRAAPAYWVYETAHATPCPARALANAGRLFFSSPANPLAATPFGKSIAAACELFGRSTRRYGRPEWNINSTVVAGELVSVTVTTVWERPFCRLLHFERAADEGTPPLPRLLIVAPMSGRPDRHPDQSDCRQQACGATRHRLVPAQCHHESPLSQSRLHARRLSWLPAALGFMVMNLDRHMEKHWRLFQHLVHGDGDSAQKHREFYDEYLAVMDLCAEFYLQTCETVFIRHALPKGEMTHRGIPVDPAQIDCVALMTVEGEHDDISGVGQNRCGGLGLRVGSAAKVRCCGDCHRPGSGMSIFPLRIRADGTAFLRQGSTLSTGRLELG
jgi:hypothetical protein